MLKRSRDPERVAYYESELALPEFPMALAYLWNAFMRMGGRRGSNGYSANPISYLEIEAFARIAGLDLAPWEVRLIEELDGVFLAEQAKQQQRE